MNSNREFDKNTPLFDIRNQTTFKRYLTLSELDLRWGFTINDLGHNQIEKNFNYPTKGHPGTHMFSWETGRKLNEYSFVLITEGKGIFESESAGFQDINAGDGFILFPGEWHRYSPLKETGWTESWVGFKGKIAETVMKNSFFSKTRPIIHNCANLLIVNLFNALFHLIAEEPFGYQRTASGVCLQLMAEICNVQKGSDVDIQSSSLISKAKYLMHKKINSNIDFCSFCKDYNISYSKFRADFKQQTGFAPFQYFLLLKVEKAKELLISTDMRIKQIAFHLGFKSDHYFSRLFKSKTKVTPKDFRESKTKHLSQIRN
jgi:AraC-like DNA-binding protein